MVDGRALVILMAEQLVVLLGQRLIATLRDSPRLSDVPRCVHTAQEIAHPRHNALG